MKSCIFLPEFTMVASKTVAIRNPAVNCLSRVGVEHSILFDKVVVLK